MVYNDTPFLGRPGGRRDKDALRIAHQPGRRLTYSFTLPRPKRKPKGYPESPKTLGEHIRKHRMDSGLQIKQLAEQIGVDEMTIINWEVGRVKEPRKNYARRLSIILPELRDLLCGYTRILGGSDIS